MIRPWFSFYIKMGCLNPVTPCKITPTRENVDIGGATWPQHHPHVSLLPLRPSAILGQSSYLPRSWFPTLAQEESPLFLSDSVDAQILNVLGSLQLWKSKAGQVSWQPGSFWGVCPRHQAASQALPGGLPGGRLPARSSLLAANSWMHHRPVYSKTFLTHNICEIHSSLSLHKNRRIK